MTYLTILKMSIAFFFASFATAVVVDTHVVEQENEPVLRVLEGGKRSRSVEVLGAEILSDASLAKSLFVFLAPGFIGAGLVYILERRKEKVPDDE